MSWKKFLTESKSCDLIEYVHVIIYMNEHFHTGKLKLSWQL